MSNCDCFYKTYLKFIVTTCDTNQEEILLDNSLKHLNRYNNYSATFICFNHCRCYGNKHFILVL